MSIPRDSFTTNALSSNPSLYPLVGVAAGPRDLTCNLLPKPVNGLTKLIQGRAPLVRNAQIQSATLHNPLPLYLHTYIWPFLAIWPGFLAVYFSEARYSKYINGSEWTTVWMGTIVSAQTLLWLMTKWNVNIDTLFTTTKASDVQVSSLIKVIPVTNSGSAEICPLRRETVSVLWHLMLFGPSDLE